MEIVTYEDVDDIQMTELTLACFDHTYSKEHVKGIVEADGRIPDWGGELYAVENNKLLGTTGILFPRAKFDTGIKKVGGIRNVCVRPSVKEKGVATKLINKAHELIEEEGVRYSFLMTDMSGKGHNLYKKLGYVNVYAYPSAFKRLGGEKKTVETKRCQNSEWMRKLYTENVEGLNGLIVREPDFWHMADARGWPDNDHVKVFYKDNEPIGYASVRERRKLLECKEVAAAQGKLPQLLTSLEELTPKKNLVIKFANPNHQETMREMGYTITHDMWHVVMVNDLEGDSTAVQKELSDRYHNGIYESF